MLTNPLAALGFAILLLSSTAVCESGTIDSPSPAANLSGDLKVCNSTTWRFEIRELSWIDRRGERRSATGYWTIDPGQTTRLLNDGELIHGREATMTLRCGSHETRWRFQDRTSDDDDLVVNVDYSLLGPPAWVRDQLTTGQRSVHRFSTPSEARTLVFRLRNLSGGGDLDLAIKDGAGNVVASSSYSGSVDDRCMLHVHDQGQYRIEVVAHDAATPTRFEVTCTSIRHANILGEALGQEAGKALIGGVLVGLFGDERDNERYWDETLSGAAQDALLLAVLEGLMAAQRATPELDPLGRTFQTILGKVRGGDDRLVSPRRAFVDLLADRIRTAAR